MTREEMVAHNLRLNGYYQEADDWERSLWEQIRLDSLYGSVPLHRSTFSRVNYKGHNLQIRKSDWDFY